MVLSVLWDFSEVDYDEFKWFQRWVRYVMGSTVVFLLRRCAENDLLIDRVLKNQF